MSMLFGFVSLAMHTPPECGRHVVHHALSLLRLACATFDPRINGLLGLLAELVCHILLSELDDRRITIVAFLVRVLLAWHRDPACAVFLVQLHAFDDCFPTRNIEFRETNEMALIDMVEARAFDH